MDETELIWVLAAAAQGVQQFLREQSDDQRQQPDPDYLRNALPSRYRQDGRPRIPASPQPTGESALLLSKLWLSLENRAGGLVGIPKGTKLLLAANCLPFLNRNGFSLPVFGQQPFMTWEHKQFYRLVTSIFLHSDLKHVVMNLGSLLQSGSCLEPQCGTAAYLASVMSLGLTASCLDGA